MQQKYIPFTISYSPMVAEELGSIHAAILYERIRFWSHTVKQGDWFYKTQAELAFETGFNLKTVKSSLNTLRDKGWIKTTFKKDPQGTPKLHFTALVTLAVGRKFIRTDEQDTYIPTSPETGYSTSPETGYTSITEKTNTISETIVSQGDNVQTTSDTEDVIHSSKSGFSIVNINSDGEIINNNKTIKENPKPIFELWGNRYPRGWDINRTERKYAVLLLSERSLEKCKNAIAFYREHKDNDFCPVITKPSELYNKWEALVAFRERQV